MATSQDFVTSSVISSTSQHKRDYAEKIRRLYPSLTKILALIRGSSVDNYGNAVYNKGLIDKKATKRMKFEWATYTAIDMFYTATSGSSTTVVLDSASTALSFAEHDTIVNTNTGEVAVVASISSATLTVTAVTGSTWSCNAGDVLCQMASAYEEGSAYYTKKTKELDTNNSYCQIFRFPVGLAETVLKTPQYTDEGMLERYMTDNMVTALRQLEAAFFFSKTGTSGTTTATFGSGGSLAAYTMQGIIPYASTTAIDLGGAFNWENWNTLLYPQMPKTMHPDETIYFVCGRRVAAAMNMWAQNKYMILGDQSDATKRFGVKPERYLMGGGVEIEVMVHELFENGSYANSGVFFQSSDLVYRFMEGLDLRVIENIQNPSVMGVVNEVRGVVGLQSWSAGANILRINNCLAA